MDNQYDYETRDNDDKMAGRKEYTKEKYAANNKDAQREIYETWMETRRMRDKSPELHNRPNNQ